ncbi:hypothetical protein FNV43_RR05776 [Rhamnella rubrinervis]|uniref:dihydroorotase n=1 Tax=Rhamnella rubrinervis TaxID=2594499 RepID=A0A8K0HNM4_9ROSA|nr:hypothetical protein FNV43_RR05776 [Rhamnella rubrinervis]
MIEQLVNAINAKEKVREWEKEESINQEIAERFDEEATLDNFDPISPMDVPTQSNTQDISCNKGLKRKSAMIETLDKHVEMLHEVFLFLSTDSGFPVTRRTRTKKKKATTGRLTVAGTASRSIEICWESRQYSVSAPNENTRSAYTFYENLFAESERAQILKRLNTVFWYLMIKTSILPSKALKFPCPKFEGPKQLRYIGTKIELTLTRPDDWHLHLCDGNLLQAVVPHSDFTPLMTLYLIDTTTPNEIKLARKSGVVFAVKLYPAGATTNSQDRVTDLLGTVHGEVTDPDIDVFDREKVFIDTVLIPLIQRLPQLKVVMEHITTMDATKFVESCKEGFIAATVTPQHLLLNRNSIFQGRLQPHNYCLPILKREIHRQVIVSAVTSGSKRFFLGTDSAPHERRRKECPCGCAGIFNAPVALSLYAKVFEEAGVLDKLEAFTSFNGPDFYELPRNTSKIKLKKTPWKVPETLSYPFGGIVPMFAGKTLEWQPFSN